MLPELEHYLHMIADLPAEALNWRPAPGVDDHAMNSLAVLAAHVAGAEHFWIAEVIGGRPATRDQSAEFVVQVEGPEALCSILTPLAVRPATCSPVSRRLIWTARARCGERP